MNFFLRRVIAFFQIRLVLGVVSFFLGAFVGANYVLNVGIGETGGPCSPVIIFGTVIIGDCGPEATLEEMRAIFSEIVNEKTQSNPPSIHQGEASENSDEIAKNESPIFAPRRASHLIMVASRDNKSRAFREYLRSRDRDVDSLVGHIAVADRPLEIFSYKLVGPLKDEVCDENELCANDTSFVFDRSVSADGSLAQVIFCPNSDTPCFKLVEEILPAGSSFCLHRLLPYQPGYNDIRFATLSKGETC